MQLPLHAVNPVVAAGICVSITALCMFLIRSRRYAGKNLPPGEMEWPIGGLQYLKTGFANLVAYEGDGPRKARLLGRPTALLRKPEHVKKVLNADYSKVGVGWPTATKIMFGKISVTTATGAFHKFLRRLLGPCFSPQAIEGHLPAIQRICERFCAEWADATAAAEAAGEASRDSIAPNSTVIERLPKLQEQARLMTFEVMAHVIAGFRFSDAQLRSLSAAFEDFMAGIFSPLPIAIPGTGFAKAVKARKVMVAALNEQIDAYRAAQKGEDLSASATQQGQQPGSDHSAGGAAAGSVMQRLMSMQDDNGKPLSRVALQDMGVNLLFAGHETTATSIVRLMLILRERPDVIAKMRAEQLVAAVKHGSNITAAALRDMPYLDAVVKEAWRVNPVVPIIPRRAEQDWKFDGYDVPKGWYFWLGLAEVLKQAPSWRDVPEGDPMDPRVFNPGRWRVTAASAALSSSGPNVADSDDEAQTRASAASAATDLRPGMLSSPIGMLPSSMLTFGTGPRYCLGANLAWAELKVFLAVMVRRYEVTAALEHMEVKLFPTITVTSGFPIKVRPLATEAAVAG